MAKFDSDRADFIPHQIVLALEQNCIFIDLFDFNRIGIHLPEIKFVDHSLMVKTVLLWRCLIVVDILKDWLRNLFQFHLCFCSLSHEIIFLAADEFIFWRLDNGQFSLQLFDIIVAWIWAISIQLIVILQQLQFVVKTNSDWLHWITHVFFSCADEGVLVKAMVWVVYFGIRNDKLHILVPILVDFIKAQTLIVLQLALVRLIWARCSIIHIPTMIIQSIFVFDASVQRPIRKFSLYVLLYCFEWFDFELVASVSEIGYWVILVQKWWLWNCPIDSIVIVLYLLYHICQTGLWLTQSVYARISFHSSEWWLLACESICISQFTIRQTHLYFHLKLTLLL